MKRIAWSLGILVLVGAAAALAQPPEGGRPGRGGPPGGPDGGPGGDFAPHPPPVIMALDVDRDHTLSAEEIKNAPEELLTLDKNKDGKLTEDEFAGPPPAPAIAAVRATDKGHAAIAERVDSTAKIADRRVPINLSTTRSISTSTRMAS